MSLRTRIALLVGVTVLLASAIGGIGTTISSRSVGLDRVDRALANDAEAFPAQGPRLASQLQFAFDARRATCETMTQTPKKSDQALPNPRQDAVAADCGSCPSLQATCNSFGQTATYSPPVRRCRFPPTRSPLPPLAKAQTIEPSRSKASDFGC